MENKQELYCEKYGIVDFISKGKFITYYTSHYSTRKEDCVTYKVTVDTEKFKEVERKQLKRYYKKGELNMYL